MRTRSSLTRACFALALGLVLTGCPKNPSGSENPPASGGSGVRPEEPKKESVAPQTADERMPEKPIVELVTSLGTIKLELFPKQAPETVKNFLGYVRAGHYSGTVFHRVISTFMIQGGGFDASLNEKPARAPIQNEAHSGLKNERGSVAMARTPNPHSAMAQFFINVKDNDFLNHREKSLEGWGYCVFGKIVGGMDVVDKIKDVPTGAKGQFDRDVPQTDVLIKEAKLAK